MSSSALVLGLDDPRAVDAAVVGGKATNLAVLRQAGFPVPEGLVLTTAASGGVGDDLSSDVQQALDLIEEWSDGRGVAVRSSGTAEDLPETSFAGQYETTLDVLRRDELESAVRASWASLHSSRVSSYRSVSGIEATSMAVLVQPMVEASCAGVVFSAHPVTGVRDQVVINAAAGWVSSSCWERSHLSSG